MIRYKLNIFLKKLSVNSQFIEIEIGIIVSYAIEARRVACFFNFAVPMTREVNNDFISKSIC